MPSNKPLVSVISPVYGCATLLGQLCEELHEVLYDIDKNYEILLINDGSPDNSWHRIQSLASDNPHVKGIDLARNFGQHAAITAGMNIALGEWIVVMDCDLQDQPKEIKKLYLKALEGYEVVFGRRAIRKDSMTKIYSSRIYRKIFDFFTDSESDPAIATFGIYKRNVVDAFNMMHEQTRTLQLCVRWLGFHATAINIEHAPRQQGASSYNIPRLLRLATNIIISQSNKPLRLSIYFGFLMSLASMIYGLYLILNYFFWGGAIAGWTSVIVSIYFIGGLLFANLGIIGLYIGKVFDETKARPIYVVRERTWERNK